MKKILTIIITIFMVSCATLSTSNDLFDTYSKYKSALQNSNNVFVKPMLSNEVRKKIESSDVDDFPILSGFAQTISTVSNNYQKIVGNKGCLTVNGYDADGGPVSLNIEYAYEQKQWLIVFVELFYPDKASDFEVTGICPARL